MRCLLLHIAVLGLVAPVPGRALGEEKPAQGGADLVVAMVGAEPIYARDVERLLDKATGGKEANPAALPVLKAQVLAEIVDRRLVMAYARRTGLAPGESEIDAALTEVKTKLELRHRSLEAWLGRQGITAVDLRRQAAWNLLWPKFLARYSTDKRIDRYFQEHRRQFDGSRVSVSHILLRRPPDAGPDAIDALVGKAEEIREEIASGKLTFAAAAAKYSSGPSAAKGGSLGFIVRHGAMVESFAAAAFGLEPGEVSRPVVTAFGVHLIRSGEIEPGVKRLAEVRGEVQEALARELLRKLADLQQRYTAVRFTGAGPHFKPGTKQLAAP